MDTYMDAYCERTGPGLLAEPLNAITNASFLIAAPLLGGALFWLDKAIAERRARETKRAAGEP